MVQRLTVLFNEDINRLPRQIKGSTVRSAAEVLGVLRERPLCNLKEMAKRTGLSVPTVSNAVQSLIHEGMVQELTGQRRNRVFAYRAYLDVLNEENLP
jgi:DNA-binding MarR family transcriptional regulator